jgi:hypothetical protein
MKRRVMAATSMDRRIEGLALRADHRVLALWAADCAERALPLFEAGCPGDPRPREAVDACREWVRTGVFRMADVRGKALAAHAAARDAAEGDAARSAARAAGQALASAHVPLHALAAAIYAATAFRDAADSDAAALREREWQYRRLKRLNGERALSEAPRRGIRRARAMRRR